MVQVMPIWKNYTTNESFEASYDEAHALRAKGEDVRMVTGTEYNHRGKDPAPPSSDKILKAAVKKERRKVSGGTAAISLADA